MKVTLDERDEVVSAVPEKRCNKCKRVLPISNFGVKSDTKDGLQIMCRSCKSTYSKELKARNEAKLTELEKIKRGIKDAVLPSGAQSFTMNYGEGKLTKVILGADNSGVQPVVDNYYDLTPAISREEVQRISTTNNIMAAVALLLEMPDKERVAVISMVTAYNNAMDGVYE